MRSLYQQQIMDHYHFPRHKGVLEGEGSFESLRAHPACGDKVTLYIQLDNDLIKNATFQGVGCILSLAAADMLLAAIIGKTLKDIELFSSHDMRKLMGVDVSSARITCILLPLEALHDLLKDQLDHA